jgi:hypothetical protein
MKSKKPSSKRELRIQPFLKLENAVNEPEAKLTEVDIGLDISTSCTGLCVLEHKTGKLISLINFKFTGVAFEHIFQKVDFFTRTWNPDPKWNIKRVFVEDIAKKFSVGVSSASTIVILAKMNAMISYVMYLKTGLKPIYVNVRSARSILNIKINTKDKTKTTKQKVFEIVNTRNPSFPWVQHLAKAGKEKGKMVYDGCNEDMADAFVAVSGGQHMGLTEEFVAAAAKIAKLKKKK